MTLSLSWHYSTYCLNRHSSSNSSLTLSPPWPITKNQLIYTQLSWWHSSVNLLILLTIYLLNIMFIGTALTKTFHSFWNEKTTIKISLKIKHDHCTWKSSLIFNFKVWLLQASNSLTITKSIAFSSSFTARFSLIFVFSISNTECR